MQVTGQTAAQGASVQCMQAIEIERSPGLPSLMVTTRRRLMPHGTSFSFLQAVTQALHSMQRSASHRNFMRAIWFSLGARPEGSDTTSCRLDLTECDLALVHRRDRIEAVGRDRVDALAEHDRICARGVVLALVLALVVAAE